MAGACVDRMWDAGVYSDGGSDAIACADSYADGSVRRKYAGYSDTVAFLVRRYFRAP